MDLLKKTQKGIFLRSLLRSFKRSRRMSDSKITRIIIGAIIIFFICNVNSFSQTDKTLINIVIEPTRELINELPQLRAKYVRFPMIVEHYDKEGNKTKTMEFLETEELNKITLHQYISLDTVPYFTLFYNAKGKLQAINVYKINSGELNYAISFRPKKFMKNVDLTHLQLTNKETEAENILASAIKKILTDPSLAEYKRLLSYVNHIAVSTKPREGAMLETGFPKTISIHYLQGIYPESADLSDQKVLNDCIDRNVCGILHEAKHAEQFKIGTLYYSSVNPMTVQERAESEKEAYKVGWKVARAIGMSSEEWAMNKMIVKALKAGNIYDPVYRAIAMARPLNSVTIPAYIAVIMAEEVLQEEGFEGVEAIYKNHTYNPSKREYSFILKAETQEGIKIIPINILIDIKQQTVIPLAVQKPGEEYVELIIRR